MAASAPDSRGSRPCLRPDSDAVRGRQTSCRNTAPVRCTRAFTGFRERWFHYNRGQQIVNVFFMHFHKFCLSTLLTRFKFFLKSNFLLYYIPYSPHSPPEICKKFPVDFPSALGYSVIIVSRKQHFRTFLVHNHMSVSPKRLPEAAGHAMTGINRLPRDSREQPVAERLYPRTGVSPPSMYTNEVGFLPVPSGASPRRVVPRNAIVFVSSPID